MEYMQPLSGSDVVIDAVKRAFYFVAGGVVFTFRDSLALFSDWNKSLGFGALFKGFLVNLKNATYIILGEMGMAIRSMHPFQNQSMFSMFGTFLSLALVTFLVYQPVSVLINILDVKRGDITPEVLRVLIALLAVLVLSVGVSYIMDTPSAPLEPTPQVNETSQVNITTIKNNVSPSYINLNE